MKKTIFVIDDEAICEGLSDMLDAAYKIFTFNKLLRKPASRKEIITSVRDILAEGCNTK